MGQTSAAVKAVLVVDDEVLNRLDLADYLGGRGFQVHEVANALKTPKLEGGRLIFDVDVLEGELTIACSLPLQSRGKRPWTLRLF